MCSSRCGLGLSFELARGSRPGALEESEAGLADQAGGRVLREGPRPGMTRPMGVQAFARPGARVAQWFFLLGRTGLAGRSEYRCGGQGFFELVACGVR